MLESRKDTSRLVISTIIDSAVTIIVGAPVQVRAVYVSKYKNMDVTEAFLFVLDGETFKLAGYQPSEGAQSLKEIKEKLRK